MSNKMKKMMKLKDLMRLQRARILKDRNSTNGPHSSRSPPSILICLLARVNQCISPRSRRSNHTKSSSGLYLVRKNCVSRFKNVNTRPYRMKRPQKSRSKSNRKNCLRVIMKMKGVLKTSESVDSLQN